MAWTAQQMAEKRAKLQKTSTGAGSSPSQSAQSAASSPKVGARGGSGTAAASGGETWTADKMAAKRAALQSSKTVQSTVSANQLEQAYENYRMGNNLGFAQEQGGTGGTVMNTDVYAGVNNWKDSSDRNRKLAQLVTQTAPTATKTEDLPAGAGYLAADTGGIGVLPTEEKKAYTDRDLQKMGYSQAEINRARNYTTAYNNLNPLEVAARRLGGTVKSVPKTVAGGVAMDVGAVPQAMTASPEEQMIRRIQSGRYTDEQLEQAGYDPELIRTAHERIASGKTLDMATDDSNRLKGLYEWGRDTHKAGERDLADAMAGESDVGRFWHGAATSAAENLVVGAINPALVLPVLSAQGAGDSMAASDEKGESPEKAVLKSALKFGAGWAINSVGAADLAKTMGSDYAKDTLAGNIADWVRGLAGDSAFAKQYPAIANAISGGMDNAMQAFVETYADQAIDAALGDSEAAKTLFSKDTLLTALERGLSGGASGALGGAVGTGLARMRGYEAATTTAASGGLREELLGQRPAGRERSETTAGSRNPAAPSRETAADGNETSQSPDGDSSPTEGSPWQDGKAVRNEQSPMERKAEGSAAEGNGSETTPDRGAAFEAAQQALKNPDAAESAAFVEPEAVIAANEAANAEAGVNGQAVENAGENVESTLSVAYGDSSPEGQQRQTAASGGLREELLGQRPAGREQSEMTAGSRNPIANASAGEAKAEGTAHEMQGAAAEDNGYVDAEVKIDPEKLDQTAWNREEQKQTARQLAANARMTTKAAQGVVDAMPEGIGAGIYAQAANSLYQLGKMEDVTGFEQAVNLTGPNSSTGGAVRQVLALGAAGENALRIAYTYGKGEAEAYNARKASEIGSGTGSLNPDAGTYFKGRNVSKGTDAMDAFIELGAKSSGTAIHRAAEGLRNNAKGFIRAAAGEMYLSGEAGSETVMHETFHLLNEWSPETGQAVMDRMMKYLVQQNGMESTEKLVESYLARYEESGVRLTWNQALEEITADAMETVFGTEDGFRNFVRQQAMEARMNAQARGLIGKVMNRIDELLRNVLADVNRFLKKEPTNAAAKAAKNLTEAQLRDLQNLYFEHQAEAGAKYREALETKQDRTTKTENAPSQTEEAGVKYSIDELDTDSEKRYAIRVGTTSEVLKSIGVKDREIVWQAGKIRKILNKHSAENHDPVTGKGSIMTKEILKQVPQVLEHPIIVVHSDTSRNADYASRIFMYGDVTDATGKPVNVSLELLPTDRKGLAVENIVLLSAYGHDDYRPGRVMQGEILYVDPDTKRTGSWLRGNRLQLPFSLTSAGPKAILHYAGNGVKAVTAEPLQGQSLYYLKAVTEEQARTLYPEQDLKYQLDVDSERVEAAKTEGLGDVEQQNELVSKAMELGGKVAVSDTGLKNIARAVLSDCDSRMDTKTLTERLRALSDYIRLNPQVDWAEANGFVMDMADQIMQKSAKRNDELWKAYPELHQMGMTIEKGSKDYREIIYRWGSWANAKKELARHGVKINQSEEGVHSRWDADFTELQKLGAGLLPTETPSSAADALEAMATAHDAIKPVMENAYSENWEEAQQDLAMQIWQRYMESPEIANEENAALRKEFSEKRQEVRDLAKQQAAEARAKAEIARLQEEQAEKDALVEPYRQMTERAMERRDNAERFAKKQRESVAAAVQRAKDRAAERVEKTRNAREMDNTRRIVRSLTSQLTQMTGTPSEKAYVPEYLLNKVRPVVMLANDAIGNHEAAKKLAEGVGDVYGPIPEGTTIRDAMDGLVRGIDREIRVGDRAALEWQQSGLQEEIGDWLEDVNENRQIEMEKLRGEIENANRWLKEETPEKKAYLARLNADLKAYQDGNMATLTMDQLRGLRDILEKTMYIVKNENVMLGSMEDVMVDDFAEGVSGELKETAEKQKDGTLRKVLREIGSVYRLNTMNIERNLERMGGYRHGGFMEQLGRMLNDGQFRKERITAEGEAIFANVTGPEHAEELHHFTTDLVDIGLKTKDGKPWLVTHNVMTELWVQLQNRQGMHHLLHGGATIADMTLSTKGLTGLGNQFSETVTLGELVTTDENGNKLNAYEISQREDSLRSNILAEIEKNLTPYDDLWIEDMRKLGKLTKRYINETSMTLYHTERARVENYIRLHVDRNTLVEQNEGVKTDRSVGSEGFMKSRQNSSKPLELVGLVKQAAESIENTAQFAGMAVPLRNVEKVLNSMQDGKTLYGEIERVWGRAGRNYMTKAMADLTGSSGGSEVFDRLSGTLRGNAAAAVLTGNLNVTLLQAASLPTAAAELGWNGAGQSAIQFVKNISGKERKAVEERAYRFGDALLPTRMRGSRRGELSTAAKGQGVFSSLHDAARNSENKALRTGVRVADAVADAAGGSIGWMDEVTVASLFYGSEQYVQKNLDEYDLTKADLPTKAQEDGSKAYQNAVLSKFQRVVERTQPNYTTMQRTGMQRTKNQVAKTLMMFSTQRQQNAQIMVSAVEDLAAQQQRYRADKSAENKAELKKAGKRMADAVSSQIVQTAVIAGLGIAVKFALHRWDDLQDENGDMTFWSLANNFIYQFFNSGVSNYTGGSEVWTAAETVLSGKSFGSYDSISMTGFSAVNDVVKSMAKLNGLLNRDTSEMTEEDFNEYEQKVRLAWADTAGQLMMLVGVPYNNGKKYVQAVFGWMDTIHQWGETGERNFNSLPSSATGQYDRLFNAIQNGDSEEAKAALGKLEGMGKSDQIASQLKRRLKQYDEDIQEAAEYQNDGKKESAGEAKHRVLERICTAYGVRLANDPKATAEDKVQRDTFVDIINGAVKEKAEELYKDGKSGSVYDALTDALETGKRKDVQEEIDRLRTAGKEDKAIKSKITAAVKEEYLAGNDHDRARLEKMLLALTKADGEALYEEKTFAQWVKTSQSR